MRLEEIITPYDLHDIDRSVPGGWCQAWCGEKVVRGMIICRACDSSWISWMDDQGRVSIHDWIHLRRLEVAGDILKRMNNCLWMEWV